MRTEKKNADSTIKDVHHDIIPIAGQYRRSIPEMPEGLMLEEDLLDWIFAFDNRTISDLVRAKNPDIKTLDIGGILRQQRERNKTGLGTKTKERLYKSFGVTIYCKVDWDKVNEEE